MDKVERRNREIIDIICICNNAYVCMYTYAHTYIYRIHAIIDIGLHLNSLGIIHRRNKKNQTVFLDDHSSESIHFKTIL